MLGRLARGNRVSDLARDRSWLRTGVYQGMHKRIHEYRQTLYFRAIRRVPKLLTGIQSISCGSVPMPTIACQTCSRDYLHLDDNAPVPAEGDVTVPLDAWLPTMAPQFLAG